MEWINIILQKMNQNQIFIYQQETDHVTLHLKSIKHHLFPMSYIIHTVTKIP